MNTTAFAIIEDIDGQGSLLEIMGYSDGKVALATKTSLSYSNWHNLDLPDNKHSVTAITATKLDNNNVKVIIGFANARLLIIEANIENGKQKIAQDKTLSLSDNPYSIIGIGIINQDSFAVAFSNKTLCIISTPDFKETPATALPGDLDIKTMVILSNLAGGIAVYVLDNNENLHVCYYDNNQNSWFPADKPHEIQKNVLKIATPVVGSNRIVFATTDNKVWQMNPYKNKLPKQIDISNTNNNNSNANNDSSNTNNNNFSSIDISKMAAITSSDNMLYYIGSDGKSGCLPLRPPTITALAIIESFVRDQPIAIEVQGYSDGNVALTNPTTNDEKPKPIDTKYLPPNKPPVTAIAVSKYDNGYVKVIIGFKNANVLVLQVAIKNGIPQITEHRIFKVDGADSASITGIGIISQNFIAVALSNKKIAIYKSESFIGSKGTQDKIERLQNINPTIPCASDIETTAIFPITTSNELIVAIHVCVLTKDKSLYLYKYDHKFTSGSTDATPPIRANVSKIATPAIGSNRIVFATTDNKMWQIEIDQYQNLQIKQISTSNANNNNSSIDISEISAMALSSGNLHTKTKTDRYEQQQNLSFLSGLSTKISLPSSSSNITLDSPNWPQTITAFAIIENLGAPSSNNNSNVQGIISLGSSAVTIRVEGYGNGVVCFTNTVTNYKKPLQAKPFMSGNNQVNSKSETQKKPAVTAIATTKSENGDYAIVVIGFNDADILIITVDRELNIKHPPILSLFEGSINRDSIPSITGIGLLDDKKSCVAVLSNGEIKIIDFYVGNPQITTHPSAAIRREGSNFSKFIGFGGQNKNKSQIPDSLTINNATANTTVILSKMQQNSQLEYYIYVLDKNGVLHLCKYDQNLASISTTPISNINVPISKIATPAIGSDRIVCITTGNCICQIKTDPTQMQPPQKSGSIKSPNSISAIALNDNMLHYCLTDNQNTVGYKQQKLPPPLPPKSRN